MSAPMTVSRAARVLRAHNQWREGYGRATEPKTLTQAIDEAVRALAEHETMASVLRQIAAQPRRTREQRLASSCMALLDGVEGVAR